LHDILLRSDDYIDPKHTMTDLFDFNPSSIRIKNMKNKDLDKYLMNDKEVNANQGGNQIIGEGDGNEMKVVNEEENHASFGAGVDDGQVGKAFEYDYSKGQVIPLKVNLN